MSKNFDNYSKGNRKLRMKKTDWKVSKKRSFEQTQVELRRFLIEKEIEN